METTYNAAEHFKSLYASVPRDYEFRVTSREGWLAWQAAFRPKLREALGLHHMESDLAGYVPKAERTESLDMGNHIRESWHLWVEPTVPLPFYLLLPKESGPGEPAYQASEPGGPSYREEASRPGESAYHEEENGVKLPLILAPHGHNHPHIYAGIARDEKEEKEMQEGERDIARQAAVEEGYIAIAPTTRAFGETRTEAAKRDNRTNSCRDELVHSMLVGRTPIGERVWDMSRLIDWAIANLPVDAKRIAITGNSGGGTVSLFAAACETRIAVAVPSCYFCTFEGSIGTIHHCDCNYVPGLMRLGEMYDVAGLVAPRPFCAIAGRDDGIFPIAEVELAYERLKTIYTIAGVPERCELYIGEGGHRYYKAGAWPFVRRYFG